VQERCVIFPEALEFSIIYCSFLQNVSHNERKRMRTAAATLPQMPRLTGDQGNNWGKFGQAAAVEAVACTTYAGIT